MAPKQAKTQPKHPIDDQVQPPRERVSAAVLLARPRKSVPVAVVGTPEDLPRALQHPAVVEHRMRVVAAVAVEVEKSELREGVDRLSELLANDPIHSILVAGPIGSTTMRHVTDLALQNHCELLAVMPTEVIKGHQPVVVWSGDSPLVQLARSRRVRRAMTIKRVIDVIGATLGLVAAVPIIAVLSAAVMIESSGWPIFAHERVGFRRRMFRCYKLRTMRTDAEERLRTDPEMYERYRKNHFKIPDREDPRVTRVGRFLRRTSLDELPQLWNVLVGDMSIVGPRPIVEEELKIYGNSSDLMLSVKPGITGAWAANGRQNIGYPQRCDVELHYVRNWTVLGDFGIMFKTPLAVTRLARTASTGV